MTEILARSQERSEGLPARPLSPVARSDINNNILTETEDWRDKNNIDLSYSGAAGEGILSSEEQQHMYYYILVCGECIVVKDGKQG